VGEFSPFSPPCASLNVASALPITRVDRCRDRRPATQPDGPGTERERDDNVWLLSAPASADVAVLAALLMTEEVPAAAEAVPSMTEAPVAAAGRACAA
jgi:hypothetical protein